MSYKLVSLTGQPQVFGPVTVPSGTGTVLTDTAAAALTSSVLTTMSAAAFAYKLSIIYTDDISGAVSSTPLWPSLNFEGKAGAALGNTVGFQQRGSTLVRPFQTKIYDYAISLLDFPGADATGIGDSTSALAAAVAEATTLGCTLLIPPGTYKLTGATQINIDLGKMSFMGQGDVYFDCTNFTGTPVFQVFSSQSYPTAAYKNTTHKMGNFSMKGSKIANTVGILVGHATYTYLGQLNFENISIESFDINHKYMSNAWRISWRNCTFIDALTWMAQAPSGLTNAGEVIHYDHCQFSDGTGDIQWACAGFQIDMVACSVLNTTMFVAGQGVTVNMIGGNYENPNATAYYDYMNITADTCRVSLIGTRVVLDNPALFTDSPFKVAANSVLEFIGVLLPSGAFTFEATSGTNTYCSGAGMARGIGCTYQPVSGAKRAALSLTGSALRNGDFELGNLSGWTVSTSGSGVNTAVTTTTAPYQGTNCALLSTSVTGGFVSITQRASVLTGQLCLMSGFGKLVTAAGSGTNGQLVMNFYDYSGNKITGFASNIPTGGSWGVMATTIAQYAPTGAVTVELTANAQNGAVCAYDNLILSVV